MFLSLDSDRNKASNETVLIKFIIYWLKSKSIIVKLGYLVVPCVLLQLGKLALHLSIDVEEKLGIVR